MPKVLAKRVWGLMHVEGSKGLYADMRNTTHKFKTRHFMNVRMYAGLAVLCYYSSANVPSSQCTVKVRTD